MLRRVALVVAVALLAACSAVSTSPPVADQTAGSSEGPADGDGDATSDGGESPDGGGGPSDSLAVGVARGLNHLDHYVDALEFQDTQYAEALLEFTEDGELQPLLAASLPERLDDDGREWAVSLREGVKFHDGTPFNSESVVESINYVQQLDGVSSAGTSFGVPLLDSVEAVDELTVHLTFAEPNNAFLIGATYLRFQKITDDMANNPIGTGPYRFVSFEQGRSATFELWDDYWNQDLQPDVAGFTVRVLPDEGAQLSALRAGEIDVLMQIPPDQVDQVPSLITAPSHTDYRVVLNSRSGVTADARVRQALNYALDKQAILEQLYGGHGTIDQCQAQREGQTGFNEDLEAYPYDPDLARSLISEAGATGAELELLGQANHVPKDDELLATIAAMWTDVGISTTVRRVPEADYREAIFAQPEPRPDAFLVPSFHRTRDQSDLAAYILSDGVVSSLTDERVDEQYRAGSQFADPSERQTAFAGVSEILCEEAVFAFLFFPHHLVGAQPGISFVPHPNDVMLTPIARFRIE